MTQIQKFQLYFSAYGCELPAPCGLRSNQISKLSVPEIQHTTQAQFVSPEGELELEFQTPFPKRQRNPKNVPTIYSRKGGGILQKQKCRVYKKTLNPKASRSDCILQKLQKLNIPIYAAITQQMCRLGAADQEKRNHPLITELAAN